MNFKKGILLFSIFLVLIVAVTSVSAADDLINESQSSDIDDFDLIEFSECSSVILHVNENESVISHRRDSTDAADIFIVEGNYNGIDFIKTVITLSLRKFHLLHIISRIDINSIVINQYRRICRKLMSHNRIIIRQQFYRFFSHKSLHPSKFCS